MRSEPAIAALHALVVDRNLERAKGLVNQLRAAEKNANNQHRLQVVADRLGFGGLEAVRLDYRTQKHLHVSQSTTRMEDLVLPDEVRGTLIQMVRERQEAERLAEFGLRPRRRLLVHGPPGTGKTSLASALSSLVGLPLLAVKMSTIFQSQLGGTAAALAAIADEMERTPGVYLLDEMEVVAGSRIFHTETGSSREFANTTSALLQLLDHQLSESFLVGATNLLGQVDPAVRRRFDRHLEMPLPSRENLKVAVHRRLGPASPGQTMLQGFIDVAFDLGASYADAVRSAEDELRRMVLAGERQADPTAMTEALQVASSEGVPA